ncbi:hypothetical protein Nepgr_032193 [Nepenthes gracilis]|uniref:Mitochondrial arginine transporter BAC1 n=1 Tax=Nepenthes gracilis TaxID=150966 RepID=A0AAD3TI55_NEPGR|nr:hypothetical protein Nepgr_032193 [Nepenthes gracilis]
MAEKSSTHKEYVAGFLAGIATVVVGHPFDTVKVKLQKHNTEGHQIKYKNGLHCAARILKNEGVTGLYRGATSSFVGVAFESSLFFGMYSQMKQSLQGRLKSSGPDPLVIIPSAAYSGAAISFVLCPSELLKCRMQVQGTDSLIPNSVRYNGPIDCALRTIETEGVRGIFRGGVATLLRESLGGTVFFCVYEYVRHFMHSKLEAASHDHKSLTEFGTGVISGGLAGVAFWSAVLPLDVAKTIIQTDPDIRSTRNPFQVLHSVYRMAGIRGCYAGLGPTLLRAFPANAAAIATLEFAIKFLGIERE